MLQKMDSTGKQVAELLREFNSRSKAVLLHSVLYYFLKYHLVVHVVITLKLVIVHNRYYGNQYKRHLAVLTLETGSSVSDGLSVE